MSIGENAILNSALGISSGKTKSSFPLYFLGSFSHRESGGGGPAAWAGHALQFRGEIAK